jgi:hypothetical protein
MRFAETQKDIIIVTGCNAVGKTTATNYLRNLASSRKIPYENKIIADSQCLLEAMEKDDKKKGLHHTHDWCKSHSTGHRHDKDHLIFPFTVIDNGLPDNMRKTFFKKLAKLPQKNTYWFVEWAGGVNIHPDSPVNYSYAYVKYMLEKGLLQDKWLKRVKAIIHVTAEKEIRFTLNKQRKIPFSVRPEAIEEGTAFWQKNEQVLDFYGKDDFSQIEELFLSENIAVHKIENNGNCSFFENLEKIADTVFLAESTDVIKATATMSLGTIMDGATSLISGIKNTVPDLQSPLFWTLSKHKK